MISEAVKRALARTEERLFCSKTIEGLLARREAGCPLPADEDDLASLAAELRRAQAPDGSWGGSLLQTAESLLWLADLLEAAGRPLVDPAAARALAWLKTRRGAPGRFGDGCTPRDHELGFCHHFLGGFFAPGPSESSLGGLELACGVRIERDAFARLVASTVALQSSLRWGVRGPDVELHLDGLRRIVRLWERWENCIFPQSVLLAASAALLDAEPPNGHGNAPDETILRAIACIAGAQRADGSWPDADVFQVLDVLHAAAARGYLMREVVAAIRRGAELLAFSQQEDGTWDGRRAVPRRTLIGWRTLHFAVDHMTAGARPRAANG
jgi:hypothetical protein